MNKIEYVARILCLAARQNPDALEPGDYPCIDGRTEKDEPGHWRWRDFDHTAKKIVDGLDALDNQNESENQSIAKMEVFAEIDYAETFPGSNKLNWGEIGLGTINKWVRLFPRIPVTDGTPTAEFDIESIQRTIENWWRNCENAP